MFKKIKEIFEKYFLIGLLIVFLLSLISSISFWAIVELRQGKTDSIKLITLNHELKQLDKRMERITDKVIQRFEDEAVAQQLCYIMGTIDAKGGVAEGKVCSLYKTSETNRLKITEFTKRNYKGKKQEIMLKYIDKYYKLIEEKNK